MEFKVDSCHTGIEEMSQNLLHQIEREFFDLSRWSMSFMHNLKEGGDFAGKTISLVWKPSIVVYTFLKRKHEESRGNHLQIINVKTVHWGNREHVTKHDIERQYGEIRRDNKKSEFEDEDQTVRLHFLLRKKQLKYSNVCEENPEVLMPVQVRLILCIPLISKRLGFPFIHKASNEWKLNHILGYGNDETKIIAPVGGGPIRLFCSFNITLSNLRGMYDMDHVNRFANQYGMNYKLWNNIIWEQNHSNGS